MIRLKNLLTEQPSDERSHIWGYKELWPAVGVFAAAWVADIHLITKQLGFAMAKRAEMRQANEDLLVNVLKELQETLRPEQWKLIGNLFQTHQTQLTAALNQQITNRAAKQQSNNADLLYDMLAESIVEIIMKFVNSKLTAKNYQLDAAQSNALAASFKNFSRQWAETMKHSQSHVADTGYAVGKRVKKFK